VWPWLRRVWPRDIELVESATSESFAQLAIATDHAFDDAVAALLPFMTVTERWGFTVNELAASPHPDRHPRASLEMLGRLVSSNDVQFIEKLRDVLDRVVAADPALRTHNIFQRYDVAMRAVGR